MEFRYKIMPGTLAYTGKELRSRWVAETTGLSGDAAAVFFGPCQVATEDLVDLDDARAGATIVAARMAHVIVEHPGCDLEVGVLRQRLLVCLLCEALVSMGKSVRRDGDDAYSDGRKLTVSIAAPSAASCLIHLGVNIDPRGAPVPAIGLEEMGLRPVELMREVMAAYQREIESAAYAAGKVRRVH
ncbi:MAG: DUF366 family protein [Candidatus Krumholzibacteria bacterium]|nr:DUF366 family protein [Candidatus Krumholzibacteria bacterium]